MPRQPGEAVRFRTRSAGPLVVRPEGDRYAMDFPSRPALPVDAPAEIAEALGTVPSRVLAARDYLAVPEDEAAVHDSRPDLARVAALDRFALIVNAPGREVDFVSRFFAPAKGVPEDPVTGSAHCTLAPYWAERLGKDVLSARQVSARGGELECRLRGDRVDLVGSAALYLEGTIVL